MGFYIACNISISSPFQEGQCHTGSKSSKTCFAGDSDFIITVGLTRMGERQIALWHKVSIYTFNEPMIFWDI